MGCLNCKKKKKAADEEHEEEKKEDRDESGKEEETEEGTSSVLKKELASDERATKSQETSTADLRSDEPIVLKLAVQLDMDIDVSSQVNPHSSDEKSSGASSDEMHQNRRFHSSEEKKVHILEAISERTAEKAGTDIDEHEKPELLTSTSVNSVHVISDSEEKQENGQEKNSEKHTKETSFGDRKDEKTEKALTPNNEKTHSLKKELTPPKAKSPALKTGDDQKKTQSVKKENDSFDTKPATPKRGEDQKTPKSVKKENDPFDTKSGSPKRGEDQKTPVSEKEEMPVYPKEDEHREDVKSGKQKIAGKFKDNVVSCIRPPHKRETEKESFEKDVAKKGDASSQKKHCFFSTDANGSESIRLSQASESNSAGASHDDLSGKRGGKLKEKSSAEGKVGGSNEDAEDSTENIKGEKSLVSESTLQPPPKKEKKPLIVRDDKMNVVNHTASGDPRLPDGRPKPKFIKKEIVITKKEKKQPDMQQRLSHIKKLPFPTLYHPRENFDEEKFGTHFGFKTYLPINRAQEVLISTEAAIENKQHADRKFAVLESHSGCVCNFSDLNERCAGRQGVRCFIRGRCADDVAAMLTMIEYSDPAVIFYAVFDKPLPESCSKSFRGKSQGMNIRRFIKPLIY